MFRSMRYAKIARVMMSQLTEEIVKVLLRNQHPDLYYSFEIKLIEAMELSYAEGLKDGKKEITDAVMKFDLEKDRLGN